MSKSEIVKALSVELKLMIPEKDLNKIKQSKNPLRTKTFKTYAELLVSVIKKLEMPKEIKEDNK